MHTLEYFQKHSAASFPGWMGLEFIQVEPKRAIARMPLQPHHLAPNGVLHAASVVALADTTCGFGCIASLPPGAASFTTIELKTNFLGTVRKGAIRCEATLLHAGRMTQVWDAAVRDEANDKVIALFRCTQMILYPKD